MFFLCAFVYLLPPQVNQQGVDTVSLAAISHGMARGSRPPDEQVERLAARMLAAEGVSSAACSTAVLEPFTSSFTAAVAEQGDAASCGVYCTLCL
jgi:hypothetical protein